MKWYNSAIVDVTFKLRGNTNLTENIKIDLFEELTDSDNQVAFVLLEEVELDITKPNQTYTVKAMEGRINDLEINGNKNIKISNLDENNRVYFNATRIAENGIFVADSISIGQNTFDWKQVDNIEAQPLGQKVFEFKLTEDESIAYLQFPYDMNTIVGQVDSIIVKYITTNGNEGNINRYVLEKFSNSIS